MEVNRDGVYEIKQLVIHGSKHYHIPYFNRYFGYNEAYECGDRDGQGSASEVSAMNRIMETPGVSEIEPGHQTGNPLFCMHLKMDKFIRSVDGTVSVTIETAEVCRFPMIDWRNPTWINPYLPKDGCKTLTKFGYGFNISASIYVNGNVKSNVTLFHKRGRGERDGAQRWDTGEQGGRISKPITLSAHAPNKDDKIDFGIFMFSTCTCSQGYEGLRGKKRPVFADELTGWFPPVDPYVWRRFGNNAQEDPVGQQINPAKLDGKWHLVRPLFYVPSEDQRRWKNVEETKE